MKKSKLIAAAMLASTLAIAGCSNEKKECSHIDEKAPYHYCDICGEKISEHYDNDHNHRCDLCGETMSEHSFGEWKVEKPATYDEEGIESRTCSICGEKESRPIPQLVHHYATTWSFDEHEHYHACIDAGYEDLRKDETPHFMSEWQVRTPATYDLDGEEFRNCECGYEETRPIPQLEHHYSGTWSFDGSHHWHQCIDAGYEALVNDYEEHHDSNYDDVCDECGGDIKKVKSITLDYLTGSIGAGESVTFSANVEASSKSSTEVEWHFEKSTHASWTTYSQYDLTDIFTLVDNHDGTATLSGVMHEYFAQFSCYVYATSVEDSTVSSKKELVYYETYNNNKRTTLNSFFGDGKWQTIPFFRSCTISLSGDKLTGYTTARSYDQMINSFDNQGLWTKEYSGYSETDYSLLADGYLYTCIIDNNHYSSGKYYPGFTISKEEVSTTFPTSKVAELVLGIGADGTVPSYDGAELYMIHEASGFGDYSNVSCVVNDADAALASYIDTLSEADYFLYTTSYGYDYYGVEGKTLLITPYVRDGKLVIELDCADSPIVKPLIEWPTDLVADALGDLAEETAVPADGTKFKVASQGTNTITLVVYGSDTDYMSKLVAAGYTISGGSTYSPVYTSSIGTIDAKVVTDYYGDGYFTLTLTSHLAPGVTTEFPLSEVQRIIGSDEASNIVAAEGTKFRLVKNEDYDVSITVEGGDLEAFKQSLVSNGFESYMGGCYSKGNLCCDVTGSSTFVINYYLATKPEPAPEGLPNEEIASYLTGVSASDLPVMESGNYTVFTAITDDVSVVAENSDIVLFRQAIQAKGGTKQDGKGNSWSLSHGLYIDITEGADYTTFTINYYVYNW